ncbi:hypothetical protein T4B_5742 [Trichinella pseudospiralis]|uniref:Uncharacterized protein n=1 Tax=Trichinella pseudospiralis TaxID=6337 RepID=A0A0V1DKI3_TRIPS|nr:hypothetical protein T4A_411 [Trichinella pseudospiralis]KRY62105.1 hypothetical protein T4A_6053 [Trichinella pseudospiralis]KRY62114.1 hypothetical protein T4A_9789 [Trichinella pseudospiralis]KRY95763.1 hypothetical protein T4B_5742 [Trichinella pseudospiralis]
MDTTKRITRLFDKYHKFCSLGGGYEDDLEDGMLLIENA